MRKFFNKTVLMLFIATGCAAAPFRSATAADGQFSDVEFNYWARPFIEKLAQQDIIAGFPDGTFKPTEPVTRAQFAAILRQAFEQSRTREYRQFTDISSNYWAVPAIREAFETGFMSGYTDGRFQPEQKIPRVQAVVSLASGLRLRPAERSVNASLIRYRDVSQIPEYAKPGVAAATQNNIVVSYPNPDYLNPNEVTTRADVAALVYQALVNQGQLEPLAQSLKANDYVVDTGLVGEPIGNQPQPVEPKTAQAAKEIVAAGTEIAVKAPGAASVQYAIVPGETYATNLVVKKAILGKDGTVLIPRGSVIRGAFKPIKVQSGAQAKTATRYVADSVRIRNRVYPIQASSSPRLATSSSEIKSEDLGQEVQTSDAAQAILRTVLPSVSETLFGKPPKIKSSAADETSVILINPETDLDLTIRSPFRLDA